MTATLKRFDANAEYYFHEGCHVIELDNEASDPALSIARARVDPGQTTRWHTLQHTVERYVILSGEGRVEVGAEPARDVGAGDVVIIPANFPQRIHNSGAVDLIFLALCTPRFVPENYIDCDTADNETETP
jgi:mannose-6-phosphate isomerase-like protein (cupin superfamily)